MEPEREQRKLEFIAKTITDLGKAIVVVGLASYFFERFHVGWRIFISGMSVALMVIGILLYPGGGDK